MQRPMDLLSAWSFIAWEALSFRPVGSCARLFTSQAAFHPGGQGQEGVDGCVSGLGMTVAALLAVLSVVSVWVV